VATRIGVALRPGDDVRHPGELVVAAGTAVRGVGDADVAHDEPVLHPVDARRSAYRVVVPAEGSEGLGGAGAAARPSCHQRLA
jgi:hypothetical protein